MGTDVGIFTRRTSTPYSVQCNVPFESMCSRPRTEILAVTKREEKEASLRIMTADAHALKGLRHFTPVVVERPYAPETAYTSEKGRDALRDLFKAAYLDAAGEGYVPASSTYSAEQLARAYTDGRLIDCCAGRRPRGRPPLTTLGREEFHLWGLSSAQTCHKNVCPLQYSIKDDEVLLQDDFPGEPPPIPYDRRREEGE